MKVEYDAFTEIYDVWVQSAPIAGRNQPFYVEEYLRTDGLVVEMGIGNGRIAIEAARRGEAQIAFLLRPTAIDDVAAISFSGGVMPQKSTDFYPKLLSGLTIYKLDE